MKLEAGVALDAVLVLVDATAFTGQLADPWLTDTLERQLARADLILLSKADLADPAAIVATRAAVLRLRPEARIAVISSGAVPEALLGADQAAGSAPTRRFAAQAPGHGFRQWCWDADASLDATKLRALLPALPASVLRAKGVCRLGPAAEPHLLQLVGRRWTLTPWTGAARPGLVLIGTEALPPPERLAALFAGTHLALTLHPTGTETHPWQ